MAELEALKVKFACFKGIVHPTHFQLQVGWGTWLHCSLLQLAVQLCSPLHLEIHQNYLLH